MLFYLKFLFILSKSHEATHLRSLEERPVLHELTAANPKQNQTVELATDADHFQPKYKDDDAEKFHKKIEKLNEGGINAIKKEKYTEGLVYLAEAEKILEYAASCGKTIDRYLITATLQN